MSDHGWGGDGGDWPDDLDPDSPEPGDAETADLGAFDGGFDQGLEHHELGGPDESLDSLVDTTPDAPLDHADDLSAPEDLPETPDPSPDPALDGGDPAGPELTPVGADPDLDANSDGWADQAFPEPLELETPEPVDGFPWTDPATLGATPLPDADAAYQGAPEADDLAAYAGEEVPPGTDPWTALSASEDPATSSLARWWSPDA